MEEKPASPLPEAIRSELLALARQGDAEKEGAMTSGVLARIERVAKTGRHLLSAIEASPSSVGAMVRSPKSGFMQMGAAPSQSDLSEEDEGSASTYIPFASSPPAENFGMTAIREIISAARNMNGQNSPARLVEALALAREKGLDDVARDIEAQLGFKSPGPAQAAPVSAPRAAPPFLAGEAPAPQPSAEKEAVR